MRIFVLALATCLVGVLAHAETTRPKSWYLAHPEERQKVLRYCYDDPGTARNNANCLNAEEAAESASVGRIGNDIDRTNARLCATLPPHTWGCP